MYDDLVPVLIIGGGPVGLALSLFLSRAGVQSLLVERHPSTTLHPRARGMNIRTMEIFRSVGLAYTLRMVGSTLDLERFTLVVDTLAGEERQRILPQGEASNYDYARTVSPEEWCLCAQDELEPQLLQAAQEHGSATRFSTELVAFEQDATGVTAQIVERTTGTKRTVRASYMVAADGANSRVRDKMLKVPLIGARVLAYHMNIYFRADLTSLVAHRQFVMCHVENPEARGIFFTVNDTDRWLFNVVYHPEKGESPEDYSNERCAEIVRKAVGIPDLEVEVLSTLSWEAATCIVEHFQVGRVFLAGDAAHIMPPFGASGVNIGVQDAHNLAWKLATVVKGLAGPELLTTYDTERRAIGDLTIQQADFRHKGIMKRVHGDDISKTAPTFKEQIAIMLSYCYNSSAVIAEEGSAPTDRTDFDARPGSRAPHFWLEQAGKRISSLDLLGQDFVLFSGEDGTAWLNAGSEVAHQLNLTLATYHIGSTGSLIDVEQSFLALYKISSGGAVLIRPDGFVAWKARDNVTKPAQTLKQALQRILAHSNVDNAPGTRTTMLNTEKDTPERIL